MQLSRMIDGKKFMWDGSEYNDEAEAKATLEKYRKDRFEARIIQEDGKFYVFSRRPVAEQKAS